MKTHLIMRVFGLLLPFSMLLGGSAVAAEAPGLYAFGNGMNGMSPQQQATLLKATGYAGVKLNNSGAAIGEAGRDAFKKTNTPVRSLYVKVDVSQPTPQYDPTLEKAMDIYANQKVDILFHIHGKGVGGKVADERIVQMLRESAKKAEAKGMRVAIYPHYNFLVERFDHATKLVAEVNQKNVGVCFNLCHYLKHETLDELEGKLTKAMPHLFWCNLNGAKQGGKHWKELILRLDEGDVDWAKIVRFLEKNDFQGEYGQQFYNIPGTPQEKLQKSFEAWKKAFK